MDEVPRETEMTRLAVLCQQATVGQRVTLRLTRGDDVSGRIEHLDDNYVMIDPGGDFVTLFSDNLAGWELHSTPGPAGGDQRPSSASTETPEPQPVAIVQADPPEVLSVLARVEATYTEAIKRARLELPEPDFQFPKSEFQPPSVRDTVRREWDRARNQYSYATKVNELSRLNSVVVQVLEPLAKRYPSSPGTRSLLGHVLLKMNQCSKAIEHLAAAATFSDDTKRWLALASAAKESPSIECYALRRYFCIQSPVNATEAWYRYLSVANPIDLNGVTHIIDTWIAKSSTSSALTTLLSESLIYLLIICDSQHLARQVATELAQNTGKLPPTWRPELESLSRPSDDLVAIERRFERSPPVDTKSSQSPEATKSKAINHGHIVVFGNQRFGFIDSNEGQTFYFRVDAVIDNTLQNALIDGSWRTFAEVQFDTQTSHGHKYHRAINVARLQDSESLLQTAQHLIRIGNHSHAIVFVRRALSATPDSEAAKQLEKEINDGLKNQRANRETNLSLPKGHGPYARAKRAQLIDQDLERAKKLLNEAIKKHDRTNSAIMDLAWLLQQQGKTDEAISLLKTNSVQLTHQNQRSYDNMLATLYQHAGRHDDALKVLTRIRDTAHSSQKESVMKRMVVSFIGSSRYEDAEQVLEEIRDSNPNDQLALQWLANLDDAKRASSDAEAQEILGEIGNLVQEGVSLSSLARAAIDGCTFEGVDPKKVQSGIAGSKEISHVEDLAKKLGTRRPRDRAAYYLSAAALLNRDIGNAGSGRIYDYLRRYFSSIADASWIDSKPADVVRSYYIESLVLVTNDEHYEAWRSLLRYILTFGSGRPNDFESALSGNRTDRVNALRVAMETIQPEAGSSFLEGLIVLGSQSSFARDSLSDVIVPSQRLRNAFGDILKSTDQMADDIGENWRAVCRSHDRIRRRRLSVCRALRKYQATAADIESLGTQVRRAMEEMNSLVVDRRRLSAMGDIVESALAFCRGFDFEEKERNFWLVTTQVEAFKKDVSDAPTQYSHEGLLPIAEHLRSLIEEQYAQMVRDSGAELSLQLLIDSYLLGPNGELKLQIQVSNERGCSPASSVRICLGPGDSEYFSADSWEREVASTLRGGDTEVTHMVVVPKASAIQDQAFLVDATAIYRNRLGEDKRTEAAAWTVRLYPDRDFQHLANPYAPFAEGGPVDDPTMFVGREDVLSRLESSLLSEYGTKSIVMYGQKRAGKSSLLEHLRRRLASHQTVLPVYFSVQEIAPRLSIAALFHRILQGIHEALDELRLEGREVPDFSPVDVDSLESHPTPKFHDCLSSLVRALRRDQAGLKIILLVDEFTDIFKGIQRQQIPNEFMKAWKSVIEKRYFASVLVGQDIMPNFKERFPNEFGVTEDERLTYLDEASAGALVQDHIGTERFVGRAVNRILDLTACSPYYTMMFCSRLVDYMNETRSVKVTEADIRLVKEEMLRGDRRLTKDKFDNLLSAGDSGLDSGIEPDDSYRVCLSIARHSEREVWCSRTLIPDFDQRVLDGLLQDLETRTVVDRKADGYRLRVGLFRDWLLLQG